MFGPRVSVSVQSRLEDVPVPLAGFHDLAMGLSEKVLAEPESLRDPG